MVGRSYFLKLSLGVLAVFFFTTTGFAKDFGCDKSGHWDFEKKIFHKIHAIFLNQEELGITEKQMEKVKDLKLSMKKDLIMKKAEIEILGVDIKSELWKDKIDVGVVNELIEKKYELKMVKTKALVKVCAELKTILTDEQSKALKDFWKTCKEDKR